MILKIGNRKLEFYNNVTVALHLESLASAFSFHFYFAPNNPDHKVMFKPGAYPAATIEHDGELLLTGVLLKPTFADSATRELLQVSGYSKAGVLDDCEIPTTSYPLQSNGLTLRQIAEKLLKPFGIKLIVDPLVSKQVNSVYKVSTADDKQTVGSYLAELASQKHVVLSHDENGDVVLTQARTTQVPIYDFTAGMPGVRYSLDFEGQKMHSSITLQKQGTKSGKGNAGHATIQNPYASTTFRPKVKRQTSGTDVDTADAARNMLSEELKGIPLKIFINSWTLNGRIVRPNNLITITNPYLYLYNKTNFLITSVEFSGNNNEQVATLTCVLPEVYNKATPKNIFN